MKVYNQSDELAKKLEASIDNTLTSMALFKKFKLQNPDVLSKIQTFIVDTEFKLEDAREARCAIDVVNFRRELTEYRSLALILNKSNPMATMCNELKDSFRKLSEAEGVMQNARLNLLKAEKILNVRKSEAQNEAAENFDILKKNKLSRQVSVV
jgi:hypothetical protein